jgi:tRNA pseudouridine55 synthase
VSPDPPPDGILLYDKPAGITSHDVVARTRRTLGRRGGRASDSGPVKVGHAGTLDGDLELPTGRVRQRPPAFSAVKVGGRRAYALARAGEQVVLAERVVEVYRFEERWREGDRRGFTIECSSGTYIRSLIADLGDAYCEELRRTAIGQFSVTDADPERIIGLEDALSFMPEVWLDPHNARRAAHGAAVAGDAGGADVVRLTDDRGLIALAAPRRDGLLGPIVGLRG